MYTVQYMHLCYQQVPAPFSPENKGRVYAFLFCLKSFQKALIRHDTSHTYMHDTYIHTSQRWQAAKLSTIILIANTNSIANYCDL